MRDFSQIADNISIQKAAKALEANGINVVIVDNADQAKDKALSLIPNSAEIMDMTSQTLAVTGIADAVQNEKYNSVKTKLNSMDKETQGNEMQKLGAAPEYAIGSAHAVTEDGKIIIASNTGSQLPAYAYGASHVIWVVGAQKIVKDLEEGMKRIYEYVLPLESERARQAYGVPGSAVNKLLIINNEINPQRLYMIIVKQPLGF